MPDRIVIIGCGSAGFSAALSTMAAGKEVVIISGNIPAVAYFSGGMLALRDDSGIIKTGADSEGIKQFINALREAGYLLRFQDSSLHQIISENAGVVETSICSEFSISADIKNLLNRRVLFLGFDNLVEYLPELLCARLKRVFQGAAGGWEVRRIPLNFLERGREFSKLSIARLLDEPHKAGRFMDSIVTSIGNRSYDVILLPSILGIESTQDIYNELRGQLKVEVGELLSAVPSVNGLRIWRAINNYLNSHNITVLRGICSGANVSGQITSVSVETGNGSVNVSGDNFIYSPGRFISGGIASGRRFFEPLFGIPLFNGDRVISGYERDLYSNDFAGTHPAFNAGIKVDRRLQPLDEHGRIFLKNLFAAGSIIQGSGLNGMISAVLTGYSAGREAS